MLCLARQLVFLEFFNGSTTSVASVIPLTGFSVAIGKISNPELTDDPLKNFIEDYKEMMKEQAETKPSTPIEVAQLKMAKEWDLPYQTI